VNRFGTFVMPFLTLFLTGRGHSPTAVAWVLSANGAGQFLSSILGGYWSDRIGRRRVIVLGTFGNAAGILAMYFVQPLWAIALMMLLAGFASGFYMPASSALLADIVPEPMRLRAYAMQRLAINAGFACGASAAGFLISISAFALFAGDALTTAMFGLIAWRFLPRGHCVERHEATWAQAWTHIRRDRAFRGLFWATIFSSLVFQQFNSTFGLELRQRGITLQIGSWHFNPEQVFGLLLGWNGLMVVIFELPLTRWTQQFDARRVIIIGYLLIGFGFALNALSGGTTLFFAGMTLFTIGEMLSQPMRNAYIAQIAPLHLRGRYMGALAMAGTAAVALGPHASLRVHAWNPQALWLGCAVLGILSALTVARSRSD
jgi:MFS family permease